jgi:hypothetical protein
MGETIERFKNTKGLFIGNIFTRDEVVQILSQLTQDIQSVFKDTEPETVDFSEHIEEISKIAERYAISFAQECAENYEVSDDSISFDTYESGNELRVTATVELDSFDLSDCASFDSSDFEDEVADVFVKLQKKNQIIDLRKTNTDESAN